MDINTCNGYLNVNINENKYEYNNKIKIMKMIKLIK